MPTNIEKLREHLEPGGLADRLAEAVEDLAEPEWTQAIEETVANILETPGEDPNGTVAEPED